MKERPLPSLIDRFRGRNRPQRLCAMSVNIIAHPPGLEPEFERDEDDSEIWSSGRRTHRQGSRESRQRQF
ncbi:hypothetical protein, partial [Sinorhizobium fredii]|uniref:hypothetical protein n=1 Tax=Rhizobium fredii TaxID=380 RepID=UPI001AEBFF39